MTLTDTGAQLYPVLRDGFDKFEATLARLTQQRTRAQVSISATNAFTVKWLVPRMADFRRRHPDIDLQLQASDDLVDLRSSAVDIAIRYGRGPYPGLAVQPLFTDRFAPVANPRLGVVSPDDLARVPLIRFDWKRAQPDNPTWERWFAIAGRPLPPEAGQLRFSDEGHAIQAGSRWSAWRWWMMSCGRGTWRSRSGPRSTGTRIIWRCSPGGRRRGRFRRWRGG